MHDTVTDNIIPSRQEASTSTRMSWRDRLESLRSWLANLFSPISCGKRSHSSVTSKSEQVSSPPTPSLPSQAPSMPQPSTTPDVVREKVHAYVDAWYEANHDGIDLGRIDLPLVGEIDVFPDEREKAIYRKVFMLALTNLLEVEVKVAGVPMRLTVVDNAKAGAAEDYG